MPTGYEVGMYRDLSIIAQAARRTTVAVERIADALERISPPPAEEEKPDGDPRP